jgi:hypothetical protein
LSADASCRATEEYPEIETMMPMVLSALVVTFLWKLSISVAPDCSAVNLSSIR